MSDDEDGLDAPPVARARHNVPFRALVIDTADPAFTNPRRSSGRDIRELAVDIGLHDLLNPLIVKEAQQAPPFKPFKNPTYAVVGGSRRWRAIAWLIEWFGPYRVPSELARALDLGELGPAATSLSRREVEVLCARARDLYEKVPVLVLDPALTPAEVEGRALADNLHREDLSSYEIAMRLFELHHGGMSGVQLARLIGKSTTYVSRKLSAFRGAGRELKAAWEAGDIAEERVQQLAELPHEKQVAALAGGSLGRGPAHRPGIDAVKDVLASVSAGDLTEQLTIAQRCEISGTGRTFTEAVYRKAVIDTLRWVAGQQSSADFARIVEPEVSEPSPSGVKETR